MALAKQLHPVQSNKLYSEKSKEMLKDVNVPPGEQLISLGLLQIIFLYFLLHQHFNLMQKLKCDTHFKQGTSYRWARYNTRHIFPTIGFYSSLHKGVQGEHKRSRTNRSYRCLP